MPSYSLRNPNSAALDEAALGAPAFPPARRSPPTATPAQTPKLKKLVEELKKAREEAQLSREEGLASTRFTLGLRPRSTGGAREGARGKVFLPDDLLAYALPGSPPGAASSAPDGAMDSGGISRSTPTPHTAKSGGPAKSPDPGKSGSSSKPIAQARSGATPDGVDQLRDLLGSEADGSKDGKESGVAQGEDLRGIDSRTASNQVPRGGSRDEDPYAIPRGTGFEPGAAASDPSLEREELADMVQRALEDAKQPGATPAARGRRGSGPDRNLEGTSDAVRQLIDTVEARPLCQYRSDQRDGDHLRGGRAHPAPIVRKLPTHADPVPAIRLSPVAEREAWGEEAGPAGSLRTEADSLESLRRMLHETDITPKPAGGGGSGKSGGSPTKAGKAKEMLEKLREVSSEEAPPSTRKPLDPDRRALESLDSPVKPGQAKAGAKVPKDTARADAPNPYLKLFENATPGGEAYQ
jgi:hypothetical protein